jgi:DHA1 family tetracycline resistance protein-like MFS transporter
MKAVEPAVKFVFITLFLDLLGIGLIIPILPKLLEQLSGHDVAHASALYGALVAAYSLMQFVFSPVMGSLSDRFGRRPVILLSLLGSGLDYVLLAVAPSVAWFFIGRILSGITGASVSAVTAYIADVSPPGKRAGNFGVIGAAFGLGFIAGPALGGVLGNHSLRLPFLMAAGLTLVNWLYGLLVLPESLVPSNRRAFDWTRASPAGALSALRQHPIVGGLAATYFLATLAQLGMHSTWVLYTGHRYAWNIRETGVSLAIVGVMAAIVQGGLARVIIPKLGERRSVTLGLLISALGMMAYALSTQGWMIYIVLVLASLGGLWGPAVQGIISEQVPANEQGAVQGALSSLASVAGIIAPPTATGMFGFFVSDQAPFYLPGAAFYLSALLMVAALVLAHRGLTRLTPSPASSCFTQLPEPQSHLRREP